MTVRIRLHAPLTHRGVAHPAGATVEVPEAVARAQIARGRAVPAEAEPPTDRRDRRARPEVTRDGD